MHSREWGGAPHRLLALNIKMTLAFGVHFPHALTTMKKSTTKKTIVARYTPVSGDAKNQKSSVNAVSSVKAQSKRKYRPKSTRSAMETTLIASSLHDAESQVRGAIDALKEKCEEKCESVGTDPLGNVEQSSLCPTSKEVKKNTFTYPSFEGDSVNAGHGGLSSFPLFKAKGHNYLWILKYVPGAIRCLMGHRDGLGLLILAYSSRGLTVGLSRTIGMKVESREGPCEHLVGWTGKKLLSMRPNLSAKAFPGGFFFRALGKVLGGLLTLLGRPFVFCGSIMKLLRRGDLKDVATRVVTLKGFQAEMFSGGVVPVTALPPHVYMVHFFLKMMGGAVHQYGQATYVERVRISEVGDLRDCLINNSQIDKAPIDLAKFEVEIYDACSKRTLIVHPESLYHALSYCDHLELPRIREAVSRRLGANTRRNWEVGWYSRVVNDTSDLVSYACCNRRTLMPLTLNHVESLKGDGGTRQELLVWATALAMFPIGLIGLYKSQSRLSCTVISTCHIRGALSKCRWGQSFQDWLFPCQTCGMGQRC